MTFPDQLVIVVDDDPNTRHALSNLLESAGLHVVTFESASDFMQFSRPNIPTCLVLNVSLPDVDGLDIQKVMSGRQYPPIVFITGHGDIPSAVRAMKAGAIDFLTKPVRDADLLTAVNAALELHSTNLKVGAELSDLERKFVCLTRRERDVFPLIVNGLLNKQAASQLGISEVTVKIHRGNVMRKMAARSLADLVKIAAKLNIGES
jgi:FixJ family two-component response regulator